MKKLKNLTIFLITLIALTLYSFQSVFALVNCSVTVSYVVSGAEFSIYHIGQIDENGNIVPNDDFASYSVSLDDSEAAQTLYPYTLRDNITPLSTGITDENKQVRFSQLEQGVYLITSKPITVDGILYTSMPTLITLAEDNPEVTVICKFTQETVKNTVDLSAVKLWKDDGNEAARPQEITVQLLMDGELKEEVVLSSDNGWKYEWKGLDGSHSWTVTEKDVASGYTVSIEKNSNSIVITNTYKTGSNIESTTSPEGTTSAGSNEKLPQTGQLWWPVPILIFFGIVFILIGLMSRKKGAEDD